jgi:hypothetical protein
LKEEEEEEEEIVTIAAYQQAQVGSTAITLRDLGALRGRRGSRDC